jgi:hypothetical protein
LGKTPSKAHREQCWLEKRYSRASEDLKEEGVSVAAGDPADFVGYCGLYCNACGIRQGKIKGAVDNLRSAIASYGFDKIMPDLAKWEPSFEHYEGFKQVMEGLVKMFGYCAGCLENGGDPNCQVRLCARQKGYRTCAECAEAKSCQKLNPYRKYAEPAFQSIKESGLQDYAKKMQKKVEAGYCFPTELDSP